MKKKLVRLLAVAAVLMAGLGWFYFNQSKTESVQETIVSSPVSQKEKSPAAVSAPAVAKPPAVVRSVEKSLQGNIIEFRVVDGLAIGYGDLILGKPESSEQTRGYYDAPTPQLWPSPEIPYAISPELPNPARVEKALDYLRQKTPIKFVPYENQRDAVIFEPGTEHCFSALGRQGGLQPIKLSPGCQSQEILHEVMHALGFIHEHSRQDRDSFVEIEWPNIEAPFQDQFAIVPETFMEALKGSSFDYHSIMLYPPGAFAVKSGLITLKSLGKDPIEPVKEGLSDGDIKRLERLYGP